jgi:hypothetical protein
MWSSSGLVWRGGWLPATSGERLRCVDAVSSVVCWAGEGCTVEVFVGDGFFDGLSPNAIVFDQPDRRTCSSGAQ